VDVEAVAARLFSSRGAARSLSNSSPLSYSGRSAAKLPRALVKETIRKVLDTAGAAIRRVEELCL